MRGDYQDYFEKLKVALVDTGAICFEESELVAKFAFPNGWDLIFECEKYYGRSGTITIVPSNGGRSFSVWILMKVFEGLTGVSYGAPTIENQVGFLRRESLRVFGDIDFYSEEYERANKVIGP